MKPRLSANSWVLIVLLGILAVIAIDVGRNYLFPPVAAQATAAAAKPMEPPFKKGDRPPDFTLPDAQGKKHTLSKLVKRDTLLFFICGCQSCRQMQTYVGDLQRKLGDRSPEMISVSTTDPAAEKAYRRDVKMDHMMLYEPQGGPIMQKYQGHPCPRVYGVSGDGKIEFVGQSPAEVGGQLQLLAYAVAEQMGFENPQSAKETPGKQKAPVMVVPPSGVPPGMTAPSMTPPGMPPGMPPGVSPPPVPAAAGGHGPGDGHNHGPGDGHGH